MISNEFYFTPYGWLGELCMKIKFAINAEKIDEILSDDPHWRCSHPEIPFVIESSNVQHKARFIKNSTAKHSFKINPCFANKGTITEQQCIDWFTKGEKMERYIAINLDYLFCNYTERRQIANDIAKSKDPTKLIERIKTKGLDISKFAMTGPKIKMPESKYIKFMVDGDITIEDLIEKCKKNDDKVKLLSKFIINDGSYQFRFLEYDK